MIDKALGEHVREIAIWSRGVRHLGKLQSTRSKR